MAKQLSLFKDNATEPQRAKRKAFPFGTYFRNEKLYLFRGDYVTVIRPWGPKAGAWMRTRCRPWKPIRPVININNGFVHGRSERYKHEALWNWPNMMSYEGDNFETLQLKDAMIPFSESIPFEARYIVAWAPYRQWHCLQLINRVGQAAAELFVSNYPLAWMLASVWVFKSASKPMRAVRSLVKRKQRYILGWLGFPESDAFVRVVKKIDIRALNISKLLDIRRAAFDPCVSKRLLHQKALTAGVLYFHTDFFLFKHSSQILLDELSLDSTPESSVINWVRDLLRMNDDMGQVYRIPIFRSQAHVREVHDRILREYMEYIGEGASGFYRFDFPSPPLAASSTICPITAPADLVKEGLKQKHCVASLARFVTSGKMYFYRVLYPEYATLAIIKKGSRWGLHDIRGYANKNVSDETRDVVERWLLITQGKLG